MELEEIKEKLKGIKNNIPVTIEDLDAKYKRNKQKE